MAEVTVLGLGRMGAALARRLHGAGHDVTVWNRSPAAVDALSAHLDAVRVAADPAEAVRGAAVVISMLADGPATRAVLLDSHVLATLGPGTVVCDLATSGVEVARELAAQITPTGAGFLDAPVSGSVPAVESGTLLIMAAGRTRDLESARAVLSDVADRIVLLGEAGAGQAMKLCVNLVVHDLNAALSEALQLAESSGITRESAYDVLEQSVVAAPFVRYKRAAFLDAGAPVAMSLDLVSKDLGLILSAARERGVGAEVTQAAGAAVARACADGMGSADMAALSRHRG